MSDRAEVLEGIDATLLCVAAAKGYSLQSLPALRQYLHCCILRETEMAARILENLRAFLEQNEGGER